MDDVITVTIKCLYLYVPNLIPSVETQLMFNEAFQNNYKITFDEWYTGRRILSTLLVQHDLESAQQVNSPKYLFSAHQTNLRTTTPDKKLIKLYSIIWIFENIMLRLMVEDILEIVFL